MNILPYLAVLAPMVAVLLSYRPSRRSVRLMMIFEAQKRRGDK